MVGNRNSREHKKLMKRTNDVAVTVKKLKTRFGLDVTLDFLHQHFKEYSQK